MHKRLVPTFPSGFLNYIVIHIVTILEWLETGFGLVIGFIEHLQNDSLTELHILKFTETRAHIKSSEPVLAVAWKRLPKAKVPLIVGSRIVSGLSYSNSRLTLLYSTQLDGLTEFPHRLLQVKRNPIVLYYMAATEGNFDVRISFGVGV
jgi:hypothetical protein